MQQDVSFCYSVRFSADMYSTPVNLLNDKDIKINIQNYDSALLGA